MAARLGKYLAILCLFSLADGHWGSLQCFAWFNMIRDRAPETSSFSDLVFETISGANPCPLCISIQKESDREKQSSQKERSAKTTTLIGLTTQTIVIAPPAPSLRDIEGGSFGLSRTDRPPVRPPRTLA